MAAVALAAAILLLPAVVPRYTTFQLTYVGAYAIAILGLIVLTGRSGQISLGHGAFLALGGYLTALLVQRAGLPYGVALPLAALGSGVLGLALGLVALRLAGVYLALATFALAVAMPPALKHFKSVTGGSQGIVLAPVDQHLLYYVAWGSAGLLFLGTAALLGGGLGRSLRALRDNELAAISFGVNPHVHKTLAFGWSAAYAGLAGGLIALATAFVSPDTFGIALSLALVTGAVLGGLDTLWGALVGALVIEYLPLWAQGINPAAPAIAYGLALILVMVFMPAGIAGTFALALGRGRRLGKDPA